jgi:chaperonin cofactor prefoldin
MNDQELEKIWKQLDSRITVINNRTKIHTIQIKELEKKIKELENGRN